MKRLYWLISLLIVLIPFGLARAADFRTSSDSNLTIPSTEQPTDLYIGGNSLTVDANVKGDLVAAAGTIIINGDVENSLFAAGGTINLRGNVGHHVRVAGGTVTISDDIKGDLFVAGGTVTIDRAATIAGGLFVSGGTVVIDGKIQGPVRLAGGSITISGSTGSVTSYNGDLTIGKGAVVNGNLVYHSSATAKIDAGAKITGQTSYFQIKQNNFNGFKDFLNFAMVLSAIGSILLGWLLIHFLPKLSESIVRQATEKTALAFASSLLLVFVLPIVTILLLISLVGLPIGVLLGAIGWLMVIIGGVYARIILGTLLVGLVTKNRSATPTIAAVVTGVIVLALLRFIPILGPLAIFVFWLLGVGAVIQQSIQHLKSSNSQ